MLQLTGKELNNCQEKQTPVNQGIETGDKVTYYRYITHYGDKIEMQFNSPKRIVYAELAQRIWTEVIGDYEVISAANMIFLPPITYWTIYKKIAYGKEFLLGTGNKLLVNGNKMQFPTPKFYFETSDFVERGVYGIYLQDQLLYIGSSSNLKARWKEHDTAFRQKDRKSQMYSIYSSQANDIVYKALETDESIKMLFGLTAPSMWIYELIEAMYIKLLDPQYNIQGKDQSFSFKAQPGDLPISYWNVAKEILLGGEHYITKELTEKLISSLNEEC